MRKIACLPFIVLLITCASSVRAVEYTTVMDYLRATYTGGWTTDTSESAFRFNYRYTTSSALSTAMWCPPMDYEGMFNVWVWQPSGQFGLAQYSIVTCGRDIKYTVDQSVSVGKWTFLAACPFVRGGANGYVEVDNSLGRSVSADAVKFQLAVPEPSTVCTLACGSGCLVLYSRRRRRPS